ncbi:hypothetical protein ACRASX_16040 [Flavobacterium sp. TMP13]|uniref:hypothetical protein n=1 Tax=unclassified Flavobacterium TaxID=196869 RepID=UPI00076D2BD2|nr:hypothetical protein [Flavobacterium sp. TAB 87]KVV15558.1 hypothetical protein AP058_00842 [Flavobacterium sp. TAB 87]
MQSHQFTQEHDLQLFSNLISNKINKGFILEERNDELLFAVLSKGGRVIDHSFNFIIFIFTLGLWSVAWLYLTLEYSKPKKILVAIDEEGIPFEDKCFVA